ncbi:MAG TPA: uroporphyrinogen-III synthase [Gemmatimonadales bacterium]|nr:uroporphyrinogen-III synthase [Gemmatimonadales bacterium]
MSRGPESGALSGRTVVLTRSREQSRALTELLESRGATVIVVPMIQFVPAADPAPLDAALHSLTSFDIIAFTSVNAVAATFGRMAALGIGPGALDDVTIAAVGDATATALREQGVTPTAQPARATGADLAAALGAVAGRRILLPRSDLARSDLPEALRRAGAEVVDVVAYHTLPDQAGGGLARVLLERPVDAIAFASPSAVDIAIDALERAGSSGLGGDAAPAIVAIGPVTARQVETRGLKVAAVALQHDAVGLADAVVAALGARTAVPRTP